MPHVPTTDLLSRRAALFIAGGLPLAWAGASLVGTASALAQEDGSPSPSPSGEGASEIAPELPPAELPTGNLRQLDLQLTHKLDADFDDAPTESDVYALTFEPRTSEDVAGIADRLEIDGEVEERGTDTFVVSGNGELFVSPELVQFQSSETPTLADLPSDDDAIAFAEDWLRGAGLAPADLGDGDVTSRTESVGRVSVAFRPATPTPIVTPDPSANVTIGPDGTVLEAGVRWATIEVTERYLLRPAEQAWGQVEAGDAYIEAAFDDQEIADGATVRGTATYTDISVAFTSAGSVESDRFLVPVYVFTGEVEAEEGAEGTSEIRAYVPAIVSNDTPVG